MVWWQDTIAQHLQQCHTKPKQKPPLMQPQSHTQSVLPSVLLNTHTDTHMQHSNSLHVHVATACHELSLKVSGSTPSSGVVANFDDDDAADAAAAVVLSSAAFASLAMTSCPPNNTCMPAVYPCTVRRVWRLLCSGASENVDGIAISLLTVLFVTRGSHHHNHARKLVLQATSLLTFHFVDRTFYTFLSPCSYHYTLFPVFVLVYCLLSAAARAE